MRLGLIARADNSGLAVQCLEFARAMNPDKVLVIDVGHMHNDTDHCNKRTDLSRFPDATVVKGWLPDRATLKGFLDGLDVVFSAETFYNSMELAPLARRMGVRTVLQPNPEFLNRRDAPDLWVPPTGWMWGTIPGPKTLLPVPIATDRFSATPSSVDGDGASHFLHIAGRPAHLDRNGTEILLRSLDHITAEVTVTIRCQQGGYVSSLLPGLSTKKNVTLRIDPGDVDDYWELYQGDVLVMPRRYGGLCLPVNEALGAGMPVIMPDISPNNTWLPKEWLVPASLEGSFVCKQRVSYYRADHVALAAAIDRFATDPEFYARAKARALELRDEYSWDNQRETYNKVLGGA